MKKTIHFSKASTTFYFDSSFSQLKTIADKKNTVIITDEQVFDAHRSKFSGWKTIVIKAGEMHKHQQTVDGIIARLLEMEIGRNAMLVGVGGGVVTDITGYVASIYLRGIRFGFVPTTVLAMVDAAIGGKNGIDVGLYKNMVGTINQPAFLLYDVALLKTLPSEQWSYGFAEIIKHACIKDSPMFKQLQTHNLEFYKKNRTALQQLIQRNALLKIKVVQQDEFEQGDRKLLNFGHTLGHAFENKYNLPHGEAVAIGMVYAVHFSNQIIGFKQTEVLINLIEQYDLPTHANIAADDIFEILKRDKKRAGNFMNFILLEKIGKAIVYPIELIALKKLMQNK